LQVPARSGAGGGIRTHVGASGANPIVLIRICIFVGHVVHSVIVLG